MAECLRSGNGHQLEELRWSIIPLQPHVRDMGEADAHRRTVPRFLGSSQIDDIAPITRNPLHFNALKTVGPQGFEPWTKGL